MSELFPKNMSVKQAVLSTLSFFDLFQTPLTRDELSEHLVGMPTDEPKIDIYLKESPLIQAKDGLFSIRGNSIYYERFEERRLRTQKYWRKIKRWNWIFQVCPFVDLVCVCNSLPFQATNENSDIDLLVVTRKNRLFLARFALTVLSGMFGLRRHGKRVKGRFCLSFYVTEFHLNFREIALEPYDIYLAYWVKTLEPVAGDYSLYEKIFQENTVWLKGYFHTLLPHKRYYRKPKAWQLKWKERLERWLGTSGREERSREKQLRRARSKYLLLKNRQGTILSENILKFHDNDQRELFREEWVRKLEELL